MMIVELILIGVYRCNISDVVIGPVLIPKSPISLRIICEKINSEFL